ncbi:MAG TPA: hypothetical protein VGX25_25760 [Actinophytocola sp.]|uniref:hypothetical protein n=1 Tax=Actinophytocola sp. TaxID=1872138 RepID=UPI002DDD4B3D|nr:hypothetical protein [Actinophytocola sp.]HEV2782812.1 hypothetical protein [Actinophytocola sp.]
MSLTLDQIPDADASIDAGRTGALTELTVAGNRRTVLRAAALGAVTVGALALSLVRGRKARAEAGPFGLRGWDRTDCRDAYPLGYDELGDTTGAYVNTYPACFGGAWRGTTYCDAGWHKNGTWSYGTVQADHVPISTLCGEITARNAWRWTTPDGRVYRCSDGLTTYWGGPNNGQTFLTICRSPG